MVEAGQQAQDKPKSRWWSASKHPGWQPKASLLIFAFPYIAMLHYPTLPFIAMHFTCNMQCTSDFPTLQCIAPHFQSTGFRFVVQCVTLDAMQCVISAWRSKYIPIPQPGQRSAARLKSVPGFTASNFSSSSTHIYVCGLWFEPNLPRTLSLFACK